MGVKTTSIKKRGCLKSNFYRRGAEAQRFKRLLFNPSASPRLCGKNKSATSETPSSFLSALVS